MLSATPGLHECGNSNQDGDYSNHCKSAEYPKNDSGALPWVRVYLFFDGGITLFEDLAIYRVTKVKTVESNDIQDKKAILCQGLEAICYYLADLKRPASE